MKNIVDGSKCIPLTLQQAQSLKYNQPVYYRWENDSRGGLKKVKITGKVKLWKRSPERVQVPWKYGYYNGNSGYITETNLDSWTLEEFPYARFRDVRVCPATGLEEMLLEYTKDFVLGDTQLSQDDDLLEFITLIEIDRLHGEDISYELYEILPDTLNKYSPQGYCYGCHEADGEWGFWEIRDND